MWKLSDLIGDDEIEEVNGVSSEGMPIAKPKDNGWKLKENPRRWTRIFKINDMTKFNSFIIDLLEHQADTQHHARITFQFPKIKVDIWTHDLNDVTEIDKEWCDTVNDIWGGYDGV